MDSVFEGALKPLKYLIPGTVECTKCILISLLEDFKMRKRRSLAALKANLLSDYTDFIDGVSAKQIYLFVIDSFKTMVSLLMCLESLTISNT